MDNNKNLTLGETKEAGEKLGIDWSKFDPQVLIKP